MPRGSWSACGGSTGGSANGGLFDLRVLTARPGLAVLEISGDGAALFLNETGGHRWQHVSPTDRRGRIHTSTVTVAARAAEAPTKAVSQGEVREEFYRASGKGGQNRNKRFTAVRLIHEPTGITVISARERAQGQNRRRAAAELERRLQDHREESSQSSTNENRRNQIGSGERGDKRRTVREQDDSVVDHRTGKRWRFRDYIKGIIE